MKLGRESFSSAVSEGKRLCPGSLRKPGFQNWASVHPCLLAVTWLSSDSSRLFQLSVSKSQLSLYLKYSPYSLMCVDGTERRSFLFVLSRPLRGSKEFASHWFYFPEKIEKAEQAPCVYSVLLIKVKCGNSQVVTQWLPWSVTSNANSPVTCVSASWHAVLCVVAAAILVPVRPVRVLCCLTGFCNAYYSNCSIFFSSFKHLESTSLTKVRERLVYFKLPPAECQVWLQPMVW